MPTLADGEAHVDKVLASYEGQRGTLHLTNRRLIFEHKRGLVNKKYLQVGVSLSDVKSVDASHPRIGWSELVIRCRSAKNGFGASEIRLRTAMNAEMWVKKLNQIIAYNDYQEASSEVVEKDVTNVPCRYCGNPVDATRTRRCPQCGAPV